MSSLIGILSGAFPEFCTVQETGITLLKVPLVGAVTKVTDNSG